MAGSVYERGVKDVMSRELVTIDAKDSVHDALQLMAENKVSALPVVDREGHCVGLLSTSDLVEVTRDLEEGLNELERVDELLFGHFISKVGDGISHQLVVDLMSENVVSGTPDETLAAAASQMLRERIHRLPIVSNGRLVGILSTTDILEAFVEGAAQNA